MMPTRILVVDDETDLELLIRQKFRHKIRNNELEFDFAQNGVDALDKMSKSDFDLILTDINMPEMDGLTLLVKIKEQNRYYKAIVVSAYSDMQNIRVAMNRGAHDFVTKPIDFTDLETTIYKTLEEVDIIKQGILAKNNLARTMREKEIAEIDKLKAEQSEKFKQQFLANMSHEIRTPMNSIMGMTNLLIEKDPKKEQMRYLSAMKQSSENLMVIINDILDLSKIEAGKMELESIHFDLARVLDGVFNTLHFKSEEKKLELQCVIEEDVPKVVIGDPTRLSQVLINLAGNSIKFTEKGKVEIRCSVLSTAEQIATLKFSVSDTGIGIAEDKIETIFESFSQASSDTTRKYGGTGLGLTISRQLVELQNGNMYVTSKFGSGTTFTFTIPFPIGSEEMVEQGKKRHDPADKAKVNNIKILLVEDNQFNQMVAVDTIESLIEGVKISLAENGREAVEKVATEKFDLVLMDIQMPEMDGYEATKNIRKLPEPNSKTPIMAMTANATKEEIEKCFEAGMDQYIGKPFDPQDLLSKIISIYVNKS